MKAPYTLLLTGGTGRIGTAIATHFARQRTPARLPLYNVAVLTRSPPNGRALLRQLTAVSDAQRQTHCYVHGDVGVAETWRRWGEGGLVGCGLREEEEVEVGLGRPSVLVNAAGFVKRGLLPRIEDGDVEEMVRANLMSAVWSSKYMFSKLLRERNVLRAEKGGEEWRLRSPCIVNISSLLGQQGGAGAAVYAAAKAGVICEHLNPVDEHESKMVTAFSRALAEEYGRVGIRVNTVVPGFIDTDMIDDGIRKFEFVFTFAYVLQPQCKDALVSIYTERGDTFTKTDNRTSSRGQRFHAQSNSEWTIRNRRGGC
jgi:NAD(P)-dependent dehydrogenase (short-subunit alcohol dehydrogenase family)